MTNSAPTVGCYPVSSLSFFYCSPSRVLYRPQKDIPAIVLTSSGLIGTEAVHRLGQEVRDVLAKMICARTLALPGATDGSLSTWMIPIKLGTKRIKFPTGIIGQLAEDVYKIPYITAPRPAVSQQLRLEIRSIGSSQENKSLQHSRLLTLSEEYLLSFSIVRYLDGASLSRLSQTCSATLSRLHTWVVAKHRFAVYDPSLPSILTRLFLASFGHAARQLSLNTVWHALHLVRMLPIYATCLQELELSDSRCNGVSKKEVEEELKPSLRRAIQNLPHLCGIGLRHVCMGTDASRAALVSSLIGHPWKRVIFPWNAPCAQIGSVIDSSLRCATLRELRIPSCRLEGHCLFSKIPELFDCCQLQQLELGRVRVTLSVLTSMLRTLAPQLRELRLVAVGFLFSQGSENEQNQEEKRAKQKDELHLLTKSLTECKQLEFLVLNEMRLPAALVPSLLPVLSSLRVLDVIGSFASQELLGISDQIELLVTGFSQRQKGPLERLAFSGRGNTTEEVLRLLPCFPQSLMDISMVGVPLESIVTSKEQEKQWSAGWQRLPYLQHVCLCGSGLSSAARYSLRSAIPLPAHCISMSPSYMYDDSDSESQEKEDL